MTQDPPGAVIPAPTGAAPPSVISPAPSTVRWTAQEEADFRASLALTERQRLIWALGVAALMWGLFGTQNNRNFPGKSHITLPFRVVNEVVLLVCWALCYRLRKYQPLEWVTFAAVASTGISTMLICHYAGGQDGPFATVLLIQTFAATLSTMPLWMMALANASILAAYAIPLTRYPVVNQVVAHHVFFQITGAGVVAVVGSMMRWRLARQEFRSRLDLSRSNGELQSLQALKDQMFQNLSHEFRTPLTLILAPIERRLARPVRKTAAQLRSHAATAEPGSRDATAEPGSEAAAAELRSEDELVQRNALRLLNLINDLLDLARLSATNDQGLGEVVEQPESVAALLGKLSEEIAPLAQRKEIQFESQLPNAPLVYRIDSAALEKMVLNLLSNALKFTPPGGRVTLSAREADDGLTLSVEDTGIGIPPEAHARIFERFRQVDGTTTRRYGGSGVGLALVSELAKRQGYALALSSVPGAGSTFSVRLPPEKRALAAPAEKREHPVEFGVELARRAAFAGLENEAPHRGVRTAGDRGPSVLLAEDDPALNRELTQLLAAHYRVRSVSDGQLAFDEALRERPDVLLSDVMMPGRDGVTLARTLREVPALRDMAIVLLSARASLDDRVRAREVGIDTYLTKPFNPRELLATVEGLLRSRMRVVGKYLLDRRLGRGGQCEVFLAEHIETSEVVALKMLSPNLSIGPNAKRWLEVEQQALAQLSHPNIVRILAQGRQENRFFLVMEYLQGSTLAELLKSGGFGFGPTAAVGHALCGALSAVHRLGLVHRDVKCENVMVVEAEGSLESRVRLIDFGIVLDLNGEVGLNETAGTLPALAPELFKGATPSPASDQFALGAALYELATGRHPFLRATRGETIAAILAGPPAPLTVAAPGIPEGLAAAIERALQTQPADRFASLEALALALAPFAAEAEQRAAIAPDFETSTSAVNNLNSRT